jgi:hypothetical protein
MIANPLKLRTRRTSETADELPRGRRRPRVRRLAVIRTDRSGFRLAGVPRDLPAGLH